MTTTAIREFIAYVYEGIDQIVATDADGVTALIVAHDDPLAEEIRRELGRNWRAVEYDAETGYRWERKVKPDVRAEYEEAWRRIRSNRATYVNAGASAAWQSYRLRNLGEPRVASPSLHARIEAYRRMQDDEQLRYFYQKGLYR